MNNTEKLLLGAGIAVAGIFAVSKAVEASNSEASGSLGGTDESLTNTDNPFGRIDPNNEIKTAGDSYYSYNIFPDGEVPNKQLNDQTLTTPPDNSGGLTIPDSNNPDSNPWYATPVGSIGLAVAGGAAWMGGESLYKSLKGRVTGEKAAAKVEAEKLSAERSMPKTAEEKIRTESGYSAKEKTPYQDLEIARNADNPSRIRETAEINAKSKEFKLTDPVTEKARTGAKGVGGKIVEGAGLALIYTQIGADLTQNFREQKPQGAGEVAGVAAYSVTKSSEGIFDFLISPIYRPERVAKDIGGSSGWFAAEKDFLERGAAIREEDLKDDNKLSVLGFARSIDVLGIESAYTKFTGSNVAATTPKPTSATINIREAVDKQIPIIPSSGGSVTQPSISTSSSSNTSKSTPVVKEISNSGSSSKKSSSSSASNAIAKIASPTTTAINNASSSPVVDRSGNKVTATSPQNAATKAAATAAAAAKTKAAANSYKKYF